LKTNNYSKDSKNRLPYSNKACCSMLTELTRTSE